eukprot:SAG31_NODE_9_length_42330_cov_441.979162_3_plen_218_part_00
MFQKQVMISCSRVDDVEHKPCPVDTASCFSRLVFGYAGPLIKEGNRKSNAGEGLEEEDLFDMPSDVCALEATEKFESLWAEEQKKPTEEQSLQGCLWQMIRPQMIVCVSLGILQTFTQLANPFILKLFLQYITEVYYCHEDVQNSQKNRCSCESLTVGQNTSSNATLAGMNVECTPQYFDGENCAACDHTVYEGWIIVGCIALNSLLGGFCKGANSP